MIELEPEVAPPAPQPRRHRRIVVAGVTLLALVAGGFAVATNGDGPGAEPLALMADGRGDTAGAESMAVGAPSPGQASADAALRSSMPAYGGWGIKFEVEGDLPELDGRAPAWTAAGPALDRAAVARIAGALGLAGSPIERDGGWWVDAGDWTLAAFPGEMWSVNLSRGRSAGRAGDSATSSGSGSGSGSGTATTTGAGDDGTVGPALSRAEAEHRVRDLIDRMGAPAGTWRAEVTETEIGIGWACATPAPGFTEELTRLEAEKLRQLGQEPAPAPTTAADGPAPDAIVASCPPPPAPVEGFNVALFPLLDGRRADWPVWNVTLRSDGRVESLHGSWVTFERAGDYKLRGVGDALKELQNPPVPEPTVTGGAVSDPDTPAVAVDGGPAVDLPAGPPQGGPAVDLPARTGGGSTGSAGSTAPDGTRLPLDGGASLPAIEPAPPVCPPMTMPIPAGEATSSFAPDCLPTEPQVVTITGVELGLVQTPVWDGGKASLYLVPAYRFTGRFDNGTPWETSMVALHPDAIAPPPDLPVRDLPVRDVPAIGTVEPATPPPAPEPARATGG